MTRVFPFLNLDPLENFFLLLKDFLTPFVLVFIAEVPDGVAPPPAGLPRVVTPVLGVPVFDVAASVLGLTTTFEVPTSASVLPITCGGLADGEVKVELPCTVAGLEVERGEVTFEGSPALFLATLFRVAFFAAIFFSGAAFLAATFFSEVGFLAIFFSGAAFLAATFFSDAGFFAIFFSGAAFLAAPFFSEVGFFAIFFSGAAFLAATFFIDAGFFNPTVLVLVAFFAVAFFAVAFFAVAFFAVAFFAVAFFAVAFFAVVVAEVLV